MSAAIETNKTEAKAEQIRAKFTRLLDKTNKEHPSAKDVKGLADLLNGNKGLELWRVVLSAAQFAERAIIENSPAVPGVKECWKHRHRRFYLACLSLGIAYHGAAILLLQKNIFGSGIKSDRFIRCGRS